VKKALTYSLHIILLVSPILLWGQHGKNSFRVIGKADGLPSPLTYKVYETSDGFYWLATGNGLARFDGRQFRVFYSFFADSNSITGNIITDLEEDKNHCLWVCSFTNGLSVFDLKKQTWKQYRHPTPDANPLYRICAVHRDKEDAMWIGTMGRGLLKYDYGKDRFVQYLLNKNVVTNGNNPDDNTIRKIADDPEDKHVLWLACMDGLYRFDKTTGQMTQFENIKNGKKSWKDNCFHTILFRKGNIIWLGTWGGGICSFNKETNAFENYPYEPAKYLTDDMSANVVLDLYPYSDTSLYVAAADGGLLEWNIHSHRYYRVIPSGKAPPQMGNAAVMGISATSKGCLWICGKEIYLRSNVYARFGDWQEIYRGGKHKYVYDSQLYYALWVSGSNTYWLACGSGDGVLVYDSNFTFLRSVYTSDRGARETDYRCLGRDSRGTIWLQTRTAPWFYYYDAKENIFRPLKDFYPASPSKEPVTKFVIDKKDRIWTVTDSLLLMYDIGQKQKKVFNICPDPLSDLKLPLTHGQIILDADDRLWIGSNIGLWSFDAGSGKWQHIYPSKLRGIHSLADAAIANIGFDKSKMLWIAPASQGLQVYDPVKRQFIQNYHVSLDAGFRASGVNFLAAAPDGNIWVSSYNGLGVYQKVKNEWEWFDQRDGLVKDYVDQPIFLMPNGKAILAQYNGFMAFDCRHWIRNEFVPRVKITDLELDGIAMAGVESASHLSVEMKTSQKRIDVSFTAVEPFFPGRLQYWYKLDGFDDKWHSTAKNQLQYGGLPPGHFTFHLKAQNSDGIWSPELRFPVNVLTPLYKKWWFAPVLSLGALLLFFALYRYRLLQVLKLQSIRNNISRDLHDDIGSSVSSVNMLSAVANKQLDEKHPVAGLLRQIGQSAQQAGESIDEIVWSINPGNDNAAITFNRIRSYVSGLLESVGIDYQIDLPEPNPGEKLVMEARQDTWLICKEAVNNSIKYAGCSKVSLTIKMGKKYMEIHIADNGKGFDLSQANGGGRNGLRNMKARVTKYRGGKFDIRTSPNNGTDIYCRLPLKNTPKM